MPSDSTYIVVGISLLLAGFVKGATGLGFPLIATPADYSGRILRRHPDSDRVNQKSFNRGLLVLLCVVGVTLLVRAFAQPS